jgi:CHAT domain-containing protein
MAALYDGRKFLVERFALASTPAISLTREAQRDSETKALVAGVTEGVQGFAPLAFVGPELDQVSDIVGGNKLKDKSFLLDRVENNFTTDQYSVVHFATHGTFSSDFRKSYLLTYDDKLTMGRLEGVLNQQNGLDLLVLSACQTAAGDDRAALGLAGVAIQAGAATALASLWSISDEGTARLIPEFYRNIYEKGMSKAHGLQEAQIRLLKDPRFEHPVFWAPYLLIGNWT